MVAITFQPLFLNSPAVAFPRPLEAPVINMVFIGAKLCPFAGWAYMRIKQLAMTSKRAGGEPRLLFKKEVKIGGVRKSETIADLCNAPGAV